MREELAAFAKRHEARDALVRPTEDEALIPLLMRLHDQAPGGAVFVVADLVWQTAPTPELLQAFAPRPGRERVRPVEGYEMQCEHAGFAIVDKIELPRDAWAHLLSESQRAAVAADARGAAKMIAWALRVSIDERSGER